MNELLNEHIAGAYFCNVDLLNTISFTYSHTLKYVSGSFIID